MTDTFLQLTPIGLIYDVFGVIYLGIAFFFKSKEAIIQESGTYWDSNPHMLHGLTSSKFDGLLGSLLLLIGFIFQMLGYLGYSYISDYVAIGIYIAPGAFSVLYFIFLRKWLVNRWVKSMTKLIEQK
jgi:hypothetical protein